MDQETVGMIARNPFVKLLQGPGCRWMRGDVAMHVGGGKKMVQFGGERWTRVTVAVWTFPQEVFSFGSSRIGCLWATRCKASASTSRRSGSIKARARHVSSSFHLRHSLFT